MTKEITTNHYKIYAETSMEQMGFVLATLTKMGLQNIGYELVTDVKNFGRNKTHETTAEQEVGEFIKQHPSFAIKEVVVHLRGQGRTASAAYTAVRVLVEKGILKKLGNANYQRADVKALAKPATEKPVHASAGIVRNRFEITGKDAIWRHIRTRTKFTSQELLVLFRAQGRNAHSVSPILWNMTKAKQIKSVGNGEYVVLKKATARKAKSMKESVADQKRAARNAADRARRAAAKPQLPNAASNGADTMEVDHG